MGKGRSRRAALTSLRNRGWSARMRSIQPERAAEASMLMRAISPSPMQLTSGSNVAAHCGRSRLVSTAKYDPHRIHIATVAIATSPKCNWDLGGIFSFLVFSSSLLLISQIVAEPLVDLLYRLASGCGHGDKLSVGGVPS